jgi:hypothetical protein
MTITKGLMIVLVATMASPVYAYTPAPNPGDQETEVGENLVSCNGPLTVFKVKDITLNIIAGDDGTCILMRKDVQKMLPKFCKPSDVPKIAGRPVCKFDGMYSVPNKNDGFTYVINRILLPN